MSQRTLWQKTKFWVSDTVRQLGVAVVIVFVLRSSVIEPYKIPSGSMIPSLFIGDHIFVNKFAYGLKVPLTEYFLDNPVPITQSKVPSRGDVIVFRYPRDESINYIKRVVGLPGDVISMRDKILFINNTPAERADLSSPEMMSGVESDEDRKLLRLYEENLLGTTHPILQDSKSLINSDFGPIEIPQGFLFVMGDNRDRSSDSRVWGFVPLENVKGKALFIWLNLVLFGDSSFFKFRFDRIGRAIP